MNERGCWIWQGAVGVWGYGNIGVDGKTMLTHRASYEAFVGPIPENAMLLHSCDTPPCCNPDHLTPGSGSQNMFDAYARGRKRSPTMKLNEEQVRAIRARIANGEMQKVIASDFGIARNTVSQISTGALWGRVK